MTGTRHWSASVPFLYRLDLPDVTLKNRCPTADLIALKAALCLRRFTAQQLNTYSSVIPSCSVIENWIKDKTQCGCLI